MKPRIFYTAGSTDALEYAVQTLQKKGCIFTEKPDGSVTDLILPTPAFDADGTIKGGGVLTDILAQLPKDITIYGGNLQSLPKDYKYFDLLQDPFYLTENADITAHCAVKLAMSKLPVTLKNCPVLVVGWGRIGKCLAKLLWDMGAIVTVAARKEIDRAMLSTLGYETENTTFSGGYGLLRYRVIFNTVPVMVLTKDLTQYCHQDCLKIDLASLPGIEGDDVIWARGLPNKEAPESSGELIARTILYKKGALL